MSSRKSLLFALGFPLLLAALSGCSMKEQTTSTSGAPVTNAGKREYYCISISTSGAYWVDARDGLAERARQLGVKAVFTGPGDYDPVMQARQFDEILAKKPSGIILVPADSAAMTSSINRAVSAGVPVITIDTDAPQSNRLCYIGTDNYQAGRKVGELLAKAIGGKGEVGISKLAGQWNIEERARGVRDALKRYPGIRVVAECNDKGEVAVAPQANAAMIAAHPNLAGIAGLDGAAGKGIAQAVVEAGKKGKIKIACFDRDDDMLAEIESGVITASVAQKSYLMSWLALTLLDSLATNSIPHLPDWNAAKAPPVPSTVDTGVMVINSSNVKQFLHRKES